MSTSKSSEFTLGPSTLAPSISQAPSTLVPSTSQASSTLAPSTLMPSTLVPSTLVPSTLVPSTLLPSTLVPATLTPSISQGPSTLVPSTSQASSTLAPSTLMPSTSQATLASVQNFPIYLPKTQKKYKVMSFNDANVDFTQWTNTKLERENNMVQYRENKPKMPNFGKGSEFNSEIREELRRKKFDANAQKYRPEAQPYILTEGGDKVKKFKGVRAGGINDNSSYYVFVLTENNTIEAYPIEEWHNFRPIERYKTLSTEEAEAEYGNRSNAQNPFTLMMNKRLQGDVDEGEIPEIVQPKNSNQLKLSDREEWMLSEDESDSDSGEENNKKEDDDSDHVGKQKSKKARTKKLQKKKEKHMVVEEAFEESDDGDADGRELYDDPESSDDSASDSESKLKIKSVAEEVSDEEIPSEYDDDGDADEDGTDDTTNKEERRNRILEIIKKQAAMKANKGQKQNNTKNMLPVVEEMSDSSSDSSLQILESQRSTNGAKKTQNMAVANASTFRSALPTTSSNDANKRKLNTGTVTVSENSKVPIGATAKKPKTPVKSVLSETKVLAAPPKREVGNQITEEAVRRYLMRKPFTTTELLAKFKKFGKPDDKMVEKLAEIIEKIKPTRCFINNKLHFSLKLKT